MRSSGVSFEREISQSAFLPGVVLVKLPVGCTSRMRFAGGGSVDFLGVIRGVPVALEAKSCRGGRFALRRITDSQLEFLRRWEACGGRSAVLLRFGFRRVVVAVISLRLLLEWISAGKRSVSAADVECLPHLPGSTRGWQLDIIPQMLEDLDVRMGQLQPRDL